MPKPIAFSVIESPSHPNISSLLNEMGYQEIQLTSIRKAIAALKKHQPALVVADFIFAYSNNYASNHISNLDSFIITFQKYPSYNPRFIFVTSKSEIEYVEKFASQYNDICSDYAALPTPVSSEQIKKLLCQVLGSGIKQH